MTIRP